jgi:hypothetical protein
LEKLFPYEEESIPLKNEWNSYSNKKRLYFSGKNHFFFLSFLLKKKKRKKRERKKKRNPKVSQPHMAHGGPPEHFEGGPAILWLVFFF